MSTIPVDRQAGAQSIFFAPKILYHRDRLLPFLAEFRRCRSTADYSEIAGIVPVTMEIDLTNVCSHRCPLCVGHRAPNAGAEQLFSVSGDGEQMPTAHAADYIEQMAAAGVKGLIFTGGGEPTVHRDLERLVGLAHTLGIDVGLITHGGLLHKRDVETLVTACTWIRVSVDAATEEEFAVVHGRGKAEWQRVWQNVDLLVAAGRRARAVGPTSATIGVAYLAGPDNLAGLQRFAEIARDHRVDYAQVRPFHRFIDFDVTPQLREAKRRFDTDGFEVVGSLQKYSRIVNGRIADRTYSYCHISQFASVICANEKMYVCCHHRNVDAFCIGDLRTQSFMDIIRSDRRAEVNACVDVNKCQRLCRGDHVNREVQSLASGQAPVAPLGLVPQHVSFL